LARALPAAMRFLIYKYNYVLLCWRVRKVSCIISYGRLSSPWLKEQRRKGEKCLEIKYIQNKPYVYDRATRSPKKVSTCISHLAKGAGLIPKGSRGSRPTSPRPGRSGCMGTPLPWPRVSVTFCHDPSSYMFCIPADHRFSHRRLDPIKDRLVSQVIECPEIVVSERLWVYNVCSQDLVQTL